MESVFTEIKIVADKVNYRLAIWAKNRVRQERHQNAQIQEAITIRYRP